METPQKKPETPPAVTQPQVEVALQEAHAGASGASAPAKPAVVTTAEGAGAQSASRAQSWWARAREQGLVLFQALLSEDPPTRRMARLFVVSLIGLLCVSSLGIYRMHELKVRSARDLARDSLEKKQELALEKKKKEEQLKADQRVDLGRFVLELKAPPVPEGARREPAPSAEFDLSVECSDMDVRDYVDSRKVEIRSVLTSALLGSTPGDFIAAEGKPRTKKRILTTLNQWLAREYPRAKVEEVWFSNLTVE